MYIYIYINVSPVKASSVVCDTTEEALTGETFGNKINFLNPLPLEVFVSFIHIYIYIYIRVSLFHSSPV